VFSFLGFFGVLGFLRLEIEGGAEFIHGGALAILHDGACRCAASAGFIEVSGPR
jgi:hypothetical protein